MKGPTKLFEKAKIGNLEVDHRFVMSPLTRTRAGRDGIPTNSMVTNYEQRACWQRPQIFSTLADLLLPTPIW